MKVLKVKEFKTMMRKMRLGMDYIHRKTEFRSTSGCLYKFCDFLYFGRSMSQIKAPS